MSQLTVLSDAELDAVSGGSRFLNAGAGGAGGAGGSAVVGGAVQNFNGGHANLSVNSSTTNAWGNGGRGGNGGNVRISLRFGGGHDW